MKRFKDTTGAKLVGRMGKGFTALVLAATLICAMFPASATAASQYSEVEFRPIVSASSIPVGSTGFVTVLGTDVSPGSITVTPNKAGIVKQVGVVQGGYGTSHRVQFHFKGLKKGTVTLTARSSEIPGKTATMTLKVDSKVSWINVAHSAGAAKPGKSIQVYAYGRPAELWSAPYRITDKISWSSSNKKVAKVNAKGKVTFNKKAKQGASVKITAKYGGKKMTTRLYVSKGNAKVRKLTAYAPTRIDVFSAGQVSPYASYSYVGSNRPLAKFSYSSSNKSIATVDAGGLVTGKKAGTVKITVKFGGKKVVKKIKIENPMP